MTAAPWQTFGIEPTTQAAFGRHQRLTTIPATAAFNLVIVYYVLEHLPRPLTVLQQLADALQPGGFCLINVPRVDRLPEFKGSRVCLNPRNHIVAFTEACLRGLLERAGLSTVATFHDVDELFPKGGRSNFDCRPGRPNHLGRALTPSARCGP